MPWNGSGVFSRTDGTRNGASVWTQARAALVRIVALDHDTHDQDLAQGINNCLTRDGQNRPVADINWNGHKLTGLSNGVASGDAVHVGQMGEGSELVSGIFRTKLDGATLKRSENGLSVNVGEGLEEGGDTCRVKLADETLLCSGAGLAVNLSGLAMFSTGDVKATFKPVADAGWVMLDDGTIGDDASSATTRAHADTEALFTLLWNNISDSLCSVSGGRGASAAEDFAAHKSMALPKALGRTLAGAGMGSGLSSHSLGATVGEENHTLTITEMPSHTHTVPSNTNSFSTSSGRVVTGATTPGTDPVTGSAGGNAAHNNMQPTLFLNFMIRL